MADLSAVTETLRSIISTILYPTPPTSKNQPSIAGVKVGVQVGWPSPQSADNDKKCEVSSVSIYPLQMERNTTRYPKVWQQTSPLAAATFTLAQAGQAITVAGANPTPWFQQNIAVFVNGNAYIYSTLPTSTAATIAAGLAALIVADFPSTVASGNIVTLPNNARIGALRVGTQANVGKEVRRQTRTIQIMILSPTPLARDAIAKAIDPVLADMPRFNLPDGFGARLLYRGSPFNDFDQKFGLFRRDFLYDVEYPTTVSDVAPEAIAARTVISQRGADGSTITPPISTQTS